MYKGELEFLGSVIQRVDPSFSGHEPLGCRAVCRRRILARFDVRFRTLRAWDSSMDAIVSPTFPSDEIGENTVPYRQSRAAS